MATRATKPHLWLCRTLLFTLLIVGFHVAAQSELGGVGAPALTRCALPDTAVEEYVLVVSQVIPRLLNALWRYHKAHGLASALLVC
jgi:hypothetical protein